MAMNNTAILLDVKTEELYSAFNPDRTSILTGDERDVGIWDTATGQRLGKFTGHKEPIEAVAWGLDQQQVFSGSHDSTIRLWELSSGQCVRVFEGLSGLYRCGQ